MSGKGKHRRVHIALTDLRAWMADRVTAKDLLAKYRCSIWTLCDQARRAGLPHKKRGRKRGEQKRFEIDRADLKDCIAGRVSMRELQAKYGCSHATIFKRVSEFRTPRPRPAPFRGGPRIKRRILYLNPKTGKHVTRQYISQLRNLEAGVCMGCGSKELATKRLCRPCQDRINALNQAGYKRRVASGRCVICGNKKLETMRLCKACRDHSNAVHRAAERRRDAK